MKILIPLLLLLLATPTFAGEGKTVSYKSGDETVQGVLYTPSGKGPFPGIIAIHEWWGLDDWVKQQASKLSDEGYVVLAVDLYRGKVAAFEYLQSQPNVKKDRIGAIGWCMGGGFALNVALREPTLAAVAIHYGHLATDPEQLKKINAPILGIFGSQDRGIPVEDVKKFEQTLKQLGKTVEIKIYPDAGHAFENPVNKDRYRPEDAADSWKRTVDFFASTLKK